MTHCKVPGGAPPQPARVRPRTWRAAAKSRSRPAASTTRPRTERTREGAEGATDDKSANLLGLYFREMAGVDVMSAEEELSIATRYAELRRSYWRAMFAYLPFVEPIVALIEAHASSEDVPRSE